jgi:VCBS repeat protein/FG-GAP repeat protein
MLQFLKIRRKGNSVWTLAAQLAFPALVQLALLQSLFSVAYAGTPATRIETQFAVADFDGDNRPDLAVFQGGQGSASATRYSIAFQLTTGALQTVGVEAPAGGLYLRPRDINGDGHPDLVVTTIWTGRPVAVFLNDGGGRFTRVPSAAFSGVFSEPEHSATSVPGGIKGPAVALTPPTLGDHCEDSAGIAPPRCVNGLYEPAPGPLVSLISCSLSFGRSPPSVALVS